MTGDHRATADWQMKLVHPIFIGAGATLLIAALVTDLLYYKTALIQWANFSAWLITGGLVPALLAALALLIEILLKRAGPISWIRFVGLAVVVVLSLLNVFVHSRDAWTSVVPQGLLLSAIETVLLLIIGWGGWSVSGASAAKHGEPS